MHTLPISQYPFKKGLQSFYPRTPAHFRTRKLRPLACIPPGRGTGVLSTDPCTFPDTDTPSVGPYPSREGHRSFYLQTPAHFWTRKLRPLAYIPLGRGTGVFIHGSLHISGHGDSVCWPVSL